MGVDFLICNLCKNTFPDCGYFVRCDCWNKWCSEKCAKEQGFRIDKECFEADGYLYESESSCKFCRNEDADDHTLLTFLLKKMNVSREDVLKQYKQYLEEQNQ